MSIIEYIKSRKLLNTLNNKFIIKFVDFSKNENKKIKEQINNIRKNVYSTELKQYTSNDNSIIEPGELFIVCFKKTSLDVIGYVSLTEPNKQFRMEKFVEPFMIRKVLKDCLNINETYEIRSLTISTEYRGSIIAIALCYCAVKWIIKKGGTDIIGIAASYLVPLYKLFGCKIYDMNIKIGNISYYLLSYSSLKNSYYNKYSIIEPYLKKNKFLNISEFEYSIIDNDVCYHGGSSWNKSGLNFLDREKIIVADVLDSAFNASPRVIQIITDNIQNVCKESPPTHSNQLIETISKVRDIPKNNILVSSGSSSLMYSVFPNMLTRKSKVLMLSPMYGEYKHIMDNVIECHVDYFHLYKEETFSIDLAKLDKIVSKYDLLIIVNPNSPTGVYCDLLEFIKRNSDTSIWVDETYIDYIGEEYSLERLIPKCNNLYICKSMSKCYALSGLRVAYLAGNIERYRKYIPPWAVSLPAQLAAIEALNDKSYYLTMYKIIHKNRKYMENTLIEKGFTIFPGCANFFLLYLNILGSEFVEKCKKYSVFLRDVKNMGDSLGNNCVRIAVKNETQNKKILEVIDLVINNKK